MKHFISYFTFAIVICLSCQSNNVDQSVINWAKKTFEGEAEHLSLPLLYGTKTKASSLSASVYPLWEKAIITNTGHSTIVEAPLSGTIKVIGSIVMIHDGQSSFLQGEAKSYLVVSSTDNKAPEMYVETFFEKGKECKMTAFSDKTNVLGFQILSDLAGNILEEKGFGGGKDFMLTQSIHLHHLEQAMPIDFLGIHWDYSALTKAAGDDHEGCPEYMDILCRVCGEFYYGNINDRDLQCPNCGEYFLNDYHGVLLCPYCLNSWEECTCDPALQECAPCGRIKGNCNGCGDGYCSCE